MKSFDCESSFAALGDLQAFYKTPTGLKTPMIIPPLKIKRAYVDYGQSENIDCKKKELDKEPPHLDTGIVAQLHRYFQRRVTTETPKLALPSERNKMIPAGGKESVKLLKNCRTQILSMWH